MHFNLKIHAIKMEKRKHIYLDFFRFYILCAFFCILNLKIHIKKDKNAKKSKTKFSKKHAKKAEMQKKKSCKKEGDVYVLQKARGICWDFFKVPVRQPKKIEYNFLYFLIYLKKFSRISRIFQDFQNFLGFSRIFQDFLGFSRIFQDFLGFSRIFQDFLGFFRILQDFIGFLRIFLHFLEYSKILAWLP